MQGSGGSLCPTITFEEALRKEMEYRKRLEKTHPHLLLALNDAFETQKFEEVDTATPDVSKRKLSPDSSISAQQSSFSCATTQRQPQNWYPTKKKVKVPQSPSQILQCPRPTVVPPFGVKFARLTVSPSLILGHILEEKNIRPKSLRFLVIGTREDLLVSVQVTQILDKKCPCSSWKQKQ